MITGGDSGIGRSVAVLYAREGADVAIVYLPEEQEDAEQIRKAVEAEGLQCLLVPGDLCDEDGQVTRVYLVKNPQKLTRPHEAFALAVQPPPDPAR